MKRFLVLHLLALIVLLWLAGCDEGGTSYSEPGPPPQEQEQEEMPQVESPPLAPPASVTVDEEQETRRRYAEILWKTALGKQYQDYIFGDYPRELFPRRCAQLADRIVSESKKIAARLAAIQLMNEDLYIVHKMTDDIRTKIQLLEAEIGKDREEQKKMAVMSLFQQVPFVFLASLPWGSPLIRTEARNFSRYSSHYLFATALRKPKPAPPGLEWRNISMSRVFEDYEITTPVQVFYKTIGPLSIIELFVVKDVAGNLSGDATLKEMIEMAEF
jgi:hypothetical protein